MEWFHSQDVVLCSGLKESYVKGDCTFPLLQFSLGNALKRAAKKTPDNVAVIYADSDVHVTFSELSHQVKMLAKGLLAEGVTKGDVILVSCGHGTDFATLFYAIVSIGAVFLMPYMYEPQHISLKQIINKVNAKMLIINGRNTSLTEALKTIAPNVLVRSGSVNTFDHMPEVPSLCAVVVYGCNGDKGLRDIFAETSTTDKQLSVVQNMVSPEDPCIVFTSTGTTGEPKAVLHGHRSMVNTSYSLHHRRNAQGRVVLGIENPLDDDVLSVMGIISATVNSDVTCVVTPVNKQCEGAISDVIVDAIEKYSITHADLLPYMWKDMMLHGSIDGHDLSRLKGGFTGSQALGVESVKSFTALVPEFMNVYGSAETSIVTANFKDDPILERRLGSIGFPVARVEVKLIDDQHNVVPIGEPGELCTRSPFIFLEYMGEPERTRTVKDEDGWYRTGDVARMDQNGFLYFIGRKADNIRFKKMGDIIYPGVIEATALKHNKVAEAQCVGIKNADDCMGDDIFLCIILKPGVNMKEGEMKEHCRVELIKRDQPDYIFIMDAFPRVGIRKKVSKAKLREICQKLILEQSDSDSQSQFSENSPGSVTRKSTVE